MDANGLAASLIETTKTCVLATASNDGKPEAATVAYAYDTDWNLYFESFATYRKYANIKENGRASVVITNHHSLQMDGVVNELSGAERERAMSIILSQHPGNKYLHEPDVLLFRFQPQWIRLLDRTESRSKFIEIKK
jgi:general stress protein 26